jgi:hypothetical protein
MSTETEIKKENLEINEQLVESSTPKQIPSIWYN